MLARDYEVDQLDILTGFDCRMMSRILRTDRHYELVVHCAADIGGRARQESHPLAIVANIGLDAAVFEWVRCGRPGHFLYLSSAAAYPLDMQIRYEAETCRRLHEDDFDRFAFTDGAYGYYKQTSETVIEDFLRDALAATRVHLVRPFSGYGADQDASYPFPALIGRVCAPDRPVTVWGSGAQVRDWIHVSDVVNAALAVVEADVIEPVNIGTGREITFASLVGMMIYAAGGETGAHFDTEMPAGVDYRVADTDRLAEIYRPKVTLEAGIDEAIAYARSVAR